MNENLPLNAFMFITLGNTELRETELVTAEWSNNRPTE